MGVGAKGRQPAKEHHLAKKPATKKKAPQGENMAAIDDPDFALKSLQEAFEKNKTFDASEEQMLKFYEQMLLIRRFEERAGQLYGLGLIGGFCHLYIGQEAVAIGLQSALDNDKDSVITGYRDHGHMLAYGIDPKVIMAELTRYVDPVADPYCLRITVIIFPRHSEILDVFCYAH